MRFYMFTLNIIFFSLLPYTETQRVLRWRIYFEEYLLTFHNMKGTDDVKYYEKGLLHQEMSDLHCRKAFDIVASSLGVPTFTPKGRRRHLERTKWPTYLRIMPSNKVRVGAKLHFFSTNQISDKQCL